jgi:hypothetical protein
MTKEKAFQLSGSGNYEYLLKFEKICGKPLPYITLSVKYMRFAGTIQAETGEKREDVQL